MHYLQGTKDLRLFYRSKQDATLIGYADAAYLLDPHKAKSQNGYVFTYGGIAISWRFIKQTQTATSSNHTELIVLYETSRECVWLKLVMGHIQEECGIKTIINSPTIIYEDNTDCIKQVSDDFIKGDRTKHIAPKLFLRT